MKRLFVVSALCLLAFGSAKAQGNAQRQRLDSLQHSVEQFLLAQSSGLPGEVSIKVSPLDARLQLAACPAPQPFLQPGARVWGKTTVGVRCSAPSWTIYMQAHVSVMADVVVSAMPLKQGQPITQEQLALVKTDLSTLTGAVITDMGQALGRSPGVSLTAGTPLRSEMLKSAQVIKQGQTVRLVSKGSNFSVSTEGRAVNNASEGQLTQVRTSSGAVVTGTARSGGIVEIII